MQLKVKAISDVNEFYSLKDQWEDLLSHSLANKLFLSWQWQFSWWSTWGDKLGLKLQILQVYDASELVGLAPLYLDDINIKGVYTLTRMQFIGNAWGKVATVRTEYLEFIVSAKKEDAVCEALIKYIAALKEWDEFVLCDIPKASSTYKYFKQIKNKYHWYQPEPVTDFGVKVDTSGDFKKYISLIGRNTRLKLYNRRKYLQGLKNVELKIANEVEIDKYFSILNEFHLQRWGKPCFREAALNFHRTFIKSLSKHQGFELSCIYIDSKPVSLLYNLTTTDTVYNVQAGFLESYDKKLSLGTIHLGYAIEQAFEDKAITVFDMLIGSGKNEFYKNRYKGETVEFETLRIVQNNIFKIYLIIYYLLPESIKSTLSIIVRKLKSIV